MGRLGHTLAWVALAIGLSSVVVQFPLTIQESMGDGRSLAGSVIFFFSYFTILTNLLAIFMMASWLGILKGKLSAMVIQSTPKAAISSAMLLVMMIYHMLLSGGRNLEGIRLVCDLGLHYAAPVIVTLWWMIAGRDRSLKWQDIPKFAAWPIIYVIYVLLRAPAAKEVPYYFLDPGEIGIGGVALHIVIISLAFLISGTAFVMYDKWRPRSS